MILLSAFLLLVCHSSHAMKLHLLGEVSFPSKTKIFGTTLGGLSALEYKNNSLWALSDDKGNVDEPRFYEFDLKISKDKVHLNPKKVHFIRGFSAPHGERTLLDPEAFVKTEEGDFIISSEGNNDRKPRVLPRLFRINSEGVFKSDLLLDEKYLPELVGQQSKGLQNNAAFEGMTLSEDGRKIWIAAEDSIVTDISNSTDENGHWIRFVEYSLKNEKNKSEFYPSKELAYRLEPFSDSKNGKEIFRGVSEILFVSENKLLVLERGVRLSQAGWSQSAALYLADLSEAQDVSAIKNISDKKIKAVIKSKIYDFETDFVSSNKNKNVQNYEGLTWGPTLPDGKKTLIVVSDNNFSKKDATEFLVFTVGAQ